VLEFVVSQVMNNSRSLEMKLFDRSHMTS